MEDQQDKRKRSEMSSVSEVDSSINEDVHERDKKSKQKKKKPKVQSELEPEIEMKESDRNLFVKELGKLNTKLVKVESSIKGVNQQLDNVLTKGDTSLKQMLKDFLYEIKEDLLKSVNKSIEVIESKLFDKEKECDNLQNSVNKLEKELETQKENIQSLRNDIAKKDDERKKIENDTEQYSRRNNLIIAGVEDSNPTETARETASKVIKMLHQKKIYDLNMADIDIAHRLPNKNNRKRDIIIKFVSRNIKADIISNRKKLRYSGMFINEDLTRLNFRIYMAVKRKRPDEIDHDQVWTKHGNVLYKNKLGEKHDVKYEDFTYWLDLPWPERQSTATRN